MAKLKVVARVTRRAKEPWRARTYCECGQEQRVMLADFEGGNGRQLPSTSIALTCTCTGGEID